MRIAIGVSVLAMLLAYQNCAKTNFGSTLDGSAGVTGAITDPGPVLTPPAVPPGPAICDPLGGGQPGASNKNGLVGSLFYVPTADQSGLQSFADLTAKSVQATAAIYMSQINVPTRGFLDGFAPAGGSALTDDKGNKLIEYFGLHMQTEVALSSADEEGYYQFAAISDDGLVVQAPVNGVTTTLAGQFDKVHSTRSDCGTLAIPLKQGDRLPLDMFYYQGPREKIAAVLVWRKVADPTVLDPKGCNVTNDGGFFATTTTGTSPMEQMASVGWKVVPSANFYLPKTAGTNPCATN